ncbi:bifunctional glycosyltransferase/CDP-glycerol:glycerophosphate glycerophosphotransferase [Leucobacter luti]|uniref:bifunctional glycosyltransferase/CDP-glycerol:glycerophosphate glycerophosphotransferase n=1 Tax=Leucobacter luti TaxID=340320 RepID=UPI003D00C5C4
MPVRVNRQALGVRVRRLMGESLKDKIRTSNLRPILWIRARLGQPHVLLGRISVVVPIYNVENYLEECLESLRIQSYPDLEILMVNDGSQDSSRDIAAEFARKDRRFVLIDKRNAGLGAARNTGVRRARGRYLTFADSDDIVAPDAYRNMVEMLKRSGSDFVVGGVERLKAGSTWRDDWVTRVHAHDQERVQLDDIPEVTKDVFAWNKLFLRRFFEEAVGEFPEGILYEDQHPTALAYTKCNSFDLLADTTYLWRMREDGSSITQGKLSERDLSDRIRVAELTGEVYRADASPEVFRYWRQKTASLDFGHYYRLSHRGSEEYWGLLRDFTRRLFEGFSPDDWPGVPIKERILAATIANDDRESTMRILNAQSQYANGVPTRFVEGRLVVDLPRWGVQQGTVSADIAAISEFDSPLRSGLTEIEWDTNSHLIVEGFVYIDKVPASITESTLHAFAVSADGAETEVPVERFTMKPDTPTLPRTSYDEHPGSGVRVRLDLETLIPSPKGRINLRFEMAAHGVRRSGFWVPQNSESKVRLAPLSLDDGTTLRVVANRREGIRVTRRAYPVALTGLRIEGRQMRCTVTARRHLRGASLHFLNRAMMLEENVSIPTLETGESVELSVEFSVRPQAWHQHVETVWEAELIRGSQRTALPYPSGNFTDLDRAESGLLAVRAGRRGALCLVDRPQTATVVSVRGSENTLDFAGSFYSRDATQPRFVLVRTDGGLIEQDSIQVDPMSGTFVARFSMLNEPEWGKPFIAKSSGIFGLCLMKPGAVDPFDSTQLLRFSDGRRNGVRYRRATSTGFAEITDLGFDRSVLVRLQGALSPADWGNSGRQVKIERIREAALAGTLLERTAVCLSFSGANVHDSPQPVAQALLRDGHVDEIVWGVLSTHQDLGPCSREVPLHSEEFIELLHRAKFLINNAHFPHYFRKRAGQTYIQTWHGTPLKKIAEDVPPTSLSNSYRDLMGREVKAWDVLLAQSPEAGQLLARAFRFRGPVLSAGYPRNDELFDIEKMSALRSAFRARFAIGENAPVVLYAPTWRDNASGTIASTVGEELQSARLLEALGNDARLLLRGHVNTMRNRRDVESGRVLDVSGWSDLTQLFAASDMLITDYSSMFFDYDLTGKPVVSFAPDLAEYSSTIRGLYFDYQETFPGPIAQTNDELVQILQDGVTRRERVGGIVEDVRRTERGNAAQATSDWVRDQASSTTV